MPVALLITIAVTVIVGVITLEILSLALNEKHIAFRCETDMSLTEPDEVATLTYRVRNTAFWPIMYVGFSFFLNDGTEIREDEEWVERHGTGGFFGGMYSFDTYLMPHRTLRGSMHFSLKHRGRHRLGKVYLETGDFLGFKTKVISFDIPGSVVCTARLLDEGFDSVMLGGFLGDVSVRRFIMEDPGLVLGYREYTGTEPIKSISWTQSAKTGRLMVKQHDFTVDTDVAVLVDLEDCGSETAEYCLSLLRTVCGRLEKLHMAYSVYSNGDLFSLEKGIGRKHYFELQRRIGVSHFVKYEPFEETVLKSSGRGFDSKGFIVISPGLRPECAAAVRRLEAVSGMKACVLCGEVEQDA